MIPPPHGGRLVEHTLPPHQAERLRDQLNEFPRLKLEIEQVYDAAKLAEGAYSPLDGFMDRTTLDSVLSSLRLPDGLPWSIPIILTPPGRDAESTIAGLRSGDQVALVDGEDRFFALLHYRERYPFDRSTTARQVYGTNDVVHPNVAALAATGPTVVAGQVELLQAPDYPFPRLELTPRRSRELFAKNGWKSVAGFQTRNLPHAGHEQLQRLTLERDDVDALFIHPIVGPLKPGDYRPGVVLEAYRSMLREYFPSNRVALGTLTISMRYAGPRAALFFALVRQNYGCSHYIVGRDQAGVASFYEPYACHRIFDGLSLGIRPVRYREMFRCQRCGGMTSDKTCDHPAEGRVRTSQTRVRAALREGRPLPLEILRPEIVEVLRRTDPLQGMTVAGSTPSRLPAAQA